MKGSLDLREGIVEKGMISIEKWRGKVERG